MREANGKVLTSRGRSRRESVDSLAAIGVELGEQVDMPKCSRMLCTYWD